MGQWIRGNKAVQEADRFFMDLPFQTSDRVPSHMRLPPPNHTYIPPLQHSCSSTYSIGFAPGCGQGLDEAAAEVFREWDIVLRLNSFSMEIFRRCLSPSQNATKGIKRGFCPFCFQILTPDNSKVRLRPKMKITLRIESLLKKQAKSQKLNLKQTKLLQKFNFSRSTLVVTCNTCQMVSKYPGENRTALANDPRTPRINVQSHKLKTIGSSRKGVLSYSEAKQSSKNKSCVQTLRPHTSTCSSAALNAKVVKKGKFQFSRLKMMLSQDEKEPIKGNLQSFLTSLT
ncbi:UPF0711 protein C18orf21 homolog [Gastrophryne carolinensis]